MTVTSIDDVVEQGIHDVISGMSHLARCIHSRAGALAMHCRRIITVIAFIAFGFLFRVEFLLAIAIAPLAVGAISLCAGRAIKVQQVHPVPSNLPATQAIANGRNTMADAGPARGTAPGLHNIVFR